MMRAREIRNVTRIANCTVLWSIPNRTHDGGNDRTWGVAATVLYTPPPKRLNCAKIYLVVGVALLGLHRERTSLDTATITKVDLQFVNIADGKVVALSEN
jgi:hypothetical protein